MLYGCLFRLTGVHTVHVFKSGPTHQGIGSNCSLINGVEMEVTSKSGRYTRKVPRILFRPPTWDDKIQLAFLVVEMLAFCIGLGSARGGGTDVVPHGMIPTWNPRDPGIVRIRHARKEFERKTSFPSLKREGRWSRRCHRFSCRSIE